MSKTPKPERARAGDESASGPEPRSPGAAAPRRADECVARAPNPGPIGSADMQRLLHLQVRQLELELQNEALRAANTELEQTVSGLAAIGERGPIGVLSIARDGTIERINRAGAALIGLAGAGPGGQPLGAFVDDESLPAFGDFLERVFATQGSQACEITVRPTGDAPPVAVRLEGCADASAQLCHLVAIDISEQKRAQDALRESEAFGGAVLDSLPEHIAVLDAQGVIVAVNASWRRFAEECGAPGLAARSVGLSYRGACEAAAGLGTGDDSMAAWAGIDAVLKGMRRNFTLEYTCDSPRASRFFRMTVHPLTGHRGGAVVSHADITASREAVDAMREARAVAERANKGKSRFLAAASHDLRQPLAALRLYIDTLHREAGPKDARLTQNMKDCVASLSELLDNLLDLSKLESGVVTPEMRDFDLGEIVRRVVSNHAPEADSKGLSLRCRPSCLGVHSDPVLFQRMLGNLVANAVRYTDRGGVLIASRRCAGTYWIEVWDTGIGVPAEMTDEIFEEFKQLGRREGRRGSGLGLAIVARTAALLGVRLRVRSRPDRGSMFAIELRPGRSSISKPDAGLAHRALRIGLVENNPHVLYALDHALQAIGHRVIAVTSGIDLMIRLGGRAPDIVVSDYTLDRGETGLDVITAARAEFGPSLPSLILTGDTDPELIREMAIRKIVVLHKPVDLDELRSCLAGLTDRRSA